MSPHPEPSLTDRGCPHPQKRTTTKGWPTLTAVHNHKRLLAIWLFVTALFAITTLTSAAQSISSQTNAHKIDLPTALRLAHASNLDVQIARERLNVARANYDTARSQFLPWLSPGVAYQRHDGRIQAVDGTMFDVSKQSYNLGGTFGAQIDVGNALYSTLVTKQVIKASEHAVESEGQIAASAAAQCYYDLVRAHALSAVLQQSLLISSNYQHQLHEAVSVGIAFKGDEFRVQSQTQRYAIDLRQAAAHQRIASARLAETLHLEPHIELVPEATELVPASVLPTNCALDSLIQQAMHARPELKQSAASTEAAREAKKGVTYGAAIPSVGARAFLGGLGGGKGSDWGNFADSEDYYVGIGWRFGPGGLFDLGRIHAAEANLQISNLSTDRLKDRITREVVEASIRVDAFRDQLGIVEENLKTAFETLRLSNERKQFGVGAVLEDIQAQQDLTRARTDYVNTIAEYIKSQYDLLRAIGDLR
jgi:outer membrane protein TolC